MDFAHHSPMETPTLTERRQAPRQGDQDLQGNSAILAGLNVQPASLAEEVEAARNQIITACRGMGTDEALVFSTLTGLSPEGKKAAAKDAIIMDWLTYDLSESELEKANGILNTTATKDVQKFASDLGVVSDYSSLATVVGVFIQGQAPIENTLFEGSIKIKVYHPTGLGFDLSFILSGEKTGEGFSLGVGVELFLGWKSQYWKDVIEAEVGWTLSADAVGTGDSATECLEILGLGLRMGIEKMSGRAAEAFMDGTTVDGIIAHMDDENSGDEADTLSLSLTAAVGGGLDIKKLGLKSGGDVGLSTEKTIGKKADGELDVKTKSVVSISNETSLNGFAVSIKGSIPLDRDSGPPQLTITPKFDLPMGDADLIAGMCQQAVVSGIAAATWLVQKHSGAPPEIDEAFQAAIFTHFYSGLHRGGKEFTKISANSDIDVNELTGTSELVPQVKLKSKVEIPIKIKNGKTSVSLKFLEEMSMEGNLVDLKYKTGQVLSIYG